MTSINSRVRCLTMAVTLAGVSPAVAQVVVPDIGGRVFGIVGGSFGDGGSTVMTSGGVGLRLTRHLGLDLEVLYVPALDLADDSLFFIQQGRAFASGFAPPFKMDRDASVTAFLTKFTVEFPTAGGRLFPYLTGGGGVGHLSERVRYRPRCNCILQAPESILQLAEPSIFFPLIFPPPRVRELRNRTESDRRRWARCPPVARVGDRRRCTMAAIAEQPRGPRHRADRLACELSLLAAGA